MNLNICPPATLRVVIAAIIVLFVGACGQKGDLYLPEVQHYIAQQLHNG